MRRISRRAVIRLGSAGAAIAVGGSKWQGETVSRLSCDVAVYGATPGGIAAAIAAARLGRQAFLLAHQLRSSDWLVGSR